VEMLSDRDVQLLDELRSLVEAKRRELQARKNNPEKLEGPAKENE